MARLIGEAYVSILPETAQFGPDADAKLQPVLRALNLQAPISTEINKSQLASSIAQIKTALASVRGNDLGLDFNNRSAISSVAELEMEVGVLRDRAKDIPLSIDDSKGLAAFYNLDAAAESLAKRIETLDPEMDPARFLAEFYTIEGNVKNLETQLAHMDMNGDPDAALEHIAVLTADTGQLASMLRNLTIDVNDTPFLAKQAALQSTVLNLAKELKNMPMDANTLPIEAKLLATRAQIEALGTALNNVGGTTKMGPEFINPTQLAAASSDLDNMAKRLDDIDGYLTRTGEQGTTTFKLMGAAVANASARLEKLQSTGIVNPADIANVKALSSDLDALAKSSGLAAAEAASASQGFGLWGKALALLKSQIPLFGGALVQLHFPDWLAQASGTHMLLESMVEFVAIWGPATVALTAFGALAINTAKDVYDQFTNMNSVADATGAKFQGLKGTLQQMEDAIQPQVMQLFGDYLTLAGNNTGHFTDMMTSLGKVLDDIGAKITMDLNSKTTSVFLEKASSDVAGLGDAFEQVGRIIGDLLKDVPGYAEILLKVGDAALTMGADVVQAINPAIAIFLKLHGAIFYLGLATTAVLAFGKAFAAAAIAKGAGEAATSLEGFAGSAATWAANFTSDNEKVAEAAGASGSKMQGLGLALGGLVGGFAAAVRGGALWVAETAALVGEFGIAETAALRFSGIMDLIPFGPAGLAAIGLGAVVGGIVYLAFQRSADAATQLNTQMSKLITSSNLADVQANIATAIKATTAAMNQQVNTYFTLQQQAANPAGRGATAYAAKELDEYTAALKTYVGQQQTATIRSGQLDQQFGSTAAAAEVLNLAGVKQSDVAKANASAWATDEQMIQATAAAYGFMNQSAGAAAGQLDAVNISTGNATKAVQTLVSAEQGWVTLITGGQTAFDAFEQGQGTLTDALKGGSAAGVKLTTTAGKLTEQQKLLGTSMEGTSTSALAAQQAFAGQLSSGVSLYGNLQQLAAASGNTGAAQKELAAGGKAIIAQLLPFAAGSKEATAELSGLAQLMGGPATDNFQTLSKWVGNTKGAEDELNKSQTALTISSANLTKAAKNLGNALATDITDAQAGAIAKTFGLSEATQNLANTAKQTGSVASQAAVVFSGEYVDALEKSGIGTSQAKQYLNAYLTQLGYTPGAVAAIDSQLGDSVSAWNNYNSVLKQNSAAAKTFQKDSTDNENALKGLNGGLVASTTYYDNLWAAISKQDTAMAKSGSSAAAAKAEFVDFAGGLAVTDSAADALWKKFGSQNLTALSDDAATTKNSFIKMATDGLGVSKTAAQQLWNEFAMQNLDELVSKGDNAKNSFIKLAEDGLNLSNSAAQSLWGTLEHQYLDTLANKAGETKNEFVKTAAQFDITRAAAEKLWGQLHTLAAGKYNVNVNETLTGSGKLVATVTSNQILIGDSGTSTPVAGVSSPAALKAASGMMIHGSGPAGKDSVHVLAAPGELIIPTTHAAKYGAMAKADGIPMASGGFVGTAPGVAATAQQGVPTMQNAAVAMTASAMKQFVGNVNTASQAQQLGGPLGPGGGSDLANMAAGMRYLAQYLFHGNMRAAAGAAASIAGESGWNPFAQGTGGRGLIGWTPPSTVSNAAFAGGLSTQLPAIIQFVRANGDLGVIAEMITAANENAPIATLAQLWGKGVERYGINDVHATGVTEATGLLSSLSSGNSTSTGATSHARGGVVRAQNPFSAGGMITEPVAGVGLNSGQSYSFGENGISEQVIPGGAASTGQQMQGATQSQMMVLINLIQTQNNLLKQQPQGFKQAVNSGMAKGANRATFATGG